MTRRLMVAMLVVASGGCFAPDLGDGQVACGAGGACPPGMSCASDQRCWQSVDGVDGGGGGGAGDGGARVSDLAVGNDGGGGGSGGGGGGGGGHGGHGGGNGHGDD